MIIVATKMFSFFNSCIMGTDDDKSVMHSIPLVQLTEGKMARLTKQLPQNATWVAVRMEELEPEIIIVKD